jgi:hypothetical protein
MSAISHETPSATRKPAARQAPAIFKILRKAVVKCAELLIQASKASAEARMHTARIEAELYRNCYRHTSKNDDELPIVEPASATQPASITLPRVAWGRAADAVVTMAKRAYPAIIVLSLLSMALAATIAIRLAIWLPGRLLLSN